MQLTIDVKDSVLDKVLYLLENLKSDVKIIQTEESSFDTLSKSELQELQKASTAYKNGDKEEFVEYKILWAINLCYEKK